MDESAFRRLRAALLGLALCTAPAHAQPPDVPASPGLTYLAARMGIAGPASEYGGDDRAALRFDRGPSAAIAGGVVRGRFALEAELGLATLDAGGEPRDGRTGDEHLASLLVAGRWLPRFNALLYGVAGVGIGATRVDWDDMRNGAGPLHASAVVPAYAGEVGIGSHFWEPMSFELTYRYHALGAFDFTDAAGRTGRIDDARHEMLIAGMRYQL